MIPALLKRSAFGAVRILGGPAIARRVLRRRLRVLCYHGVVRDEHAAGPRYRNTVTRSAFVRQMRSIARHDTPVDLATVIAWATGVRDLPDRAVLVTFDDGYRNNLTVAAPVLKSFGVPAVVALSTALIGTHELLWPTEVELRIADGDWDSIAFPAGAERIARPGHRAGREAVGDRVRQALKGLSDDACRSWLTEFRKTSRLDRGAIDGELVDFLDWDEVRALRDFGIDLASHTVTHPILSRLQSDALAHELAESKARIERESGRACDAIVYPNGKPADVSLAVFEAARRAGYAAGFDLDDHVNPERCRDPFRIRRLEIPALDSRALFETRASGCYAILRRRIAR
ncbi:MAG: polysaccharide deacetylase family protein [Planctomycetes bacterium]|nr:polysaccharide deacetylase family protein [Planctomycetota bacterium]